MKINVGKKNIIGIISDISVLGVQYLVLFEGLYFPYKKTISICHSTNINFSLTSVISFSKDLTASWFPSCVSTLPVHWDFCNTLYLLLQYKRKKEKKKDVRFGPSAMLITTTCKGLPYDRYFSIFESFMNFFMLYKHAFG